MFEDVCFLFVCLLQISDISIRILVTILQMIDTYLQCNTGWCNTIGATSGAGMVHSSGAHEFTSSFSGVRVTRFVVFCVMFCRSFCVLFFWLLPFFDLRILITPLVSSNSSYLISTYFKKKMFAYTYDTLIIQNVFWKVNDRIRT